MFNQTPPLGDIDLFGSDRVLAGALQREGATWAAQPVAAFGKIAGRADTIALGFQSNENLPVLRTHNAQGERIDEVQFHPAWHELLKTSMQQGVHSFAWSNACNGSHVGRAALFMLAAQVEAGHLCPIGMTHACIAVLRQDPFLLEHWVPRLLRGTYDPRFRPAAEKASALVGMAMTEKQGGSDVRANTSRAYPVRAGAPDNEYAITGHKWFCSAPMCDAFLVLAQSPGGLSCFFVPRWTDDAHRNNFFIQRLKNKLGNRSNASAEVEFSGAIGRMVGDEGKGVRTIIEMVNLTRLDCALASAAMMRMAVVQAIHHARHRMAFGRLIVDQPLMKNVLADLCVEWEAATLLAMRLAGAYDRESRDESERWLMRVGLPIAKYWICRRAIVHSSEALECLGGNGFVEESIMPRIYREAPLNALWEGTGNIICLDVLRALRADPAALEAVFGEIEKGCAGEPRLARYVERVKRDVPGLEGAEHAARTFVERLAIALQGSLLVRHSRPEVSDAFAASRLAPDGGRCFGTLPGASTFDAILRDAVPETLVS